MIGYGTYSHIPKKIKPPFQVEYVYIKIHQLQRGVSTTVTPLSNTRLQKYYIIFVHTYTHIHMYVYCYEYKLTYVCVLNSM